MNFGLMLKIGGSPALVAVLAGGVASITGLVAVACLRKAGRHAAFALGLVTLLLVAVSAGAGIFGTARGRAQTDAAIESPGLTGRERDALQDRGYAEAVSSSRLALAASIFPLLMGAAAAIVGALGRPGRARLATACATTFVAVGAIVGATSSALSAVYPFDESAARHAKGRHAATSASELAVASAEAGVETAPVATVAVPASTSTALGPAGPRITAAEASISSTTLTDATTVVAKNKWRFRGCYNKALASDPDAGGTVTVAVTVNEDGKVTSAKGSGGSPATLATCIAGSFYSMMFAAPSGGSGSVSVTVVLAAKR
jgi:hypothetical protein